MNSLESMYLEKNGLNSDVPGKPRITIKYEENDRITLNNMYLKSYD